MSTSAPTALDIAWFAGIIDGEGCISVKKNGNKLGWFMRLEVFNTCDLLLQKSAAILDGLNVSYGYETLTPKRMSALSKKQVKRISMSKTADIVTVLKAISPHLTSKKEKALKLIAFYETRIKGTKWTEEEHFYVQSIFKAV